jgi:hypothetical protein
MNSIKEKDTILDKHSIRLTFSSLKNQYQLA